MGACEPIVIALTAGEPAGIGPDLCVRLATRQVAARVVVIGDPEVLESRARRLGARIEIRGYRPGRADACSASLEVLPVPTKRPVVAGRTDPANAPHVLALLESAARGCLEGQFDAVVTAPVHKGVINDAGIPFQGHTEYFAALCDKETAVMMLVAPGIRVALVTTHLPLRRVAEAITAERLQTVIRALRRDLIERFGIRSPRIVVCGLNPHAGEGGHLGHEEGEIIEPTLDTLRAEGFDLRGPCPADTAFTPDRLADSDVVLAMFHDQGLPVLKHLGFGGAVNVTLGLPIIRTSVDHGTALDIAGTGAADGGSLMAALELAVTMAGHRRKSTAH
jgi:4-hydroxythreonine-4-phosphate dehydrogenase